jgi:hypothetical protein
MKLHRLRFMRVSVSETKNAEVLNGGSVMTRRRPRESGPYLPGSVVPLVVPIHKPEPFIQSTGHSLEAY